MSEAEYICNHSSGLVGESDRRMEQIIVLGEQWLRQASSWIQAGNLKDLACELISIYDNPWWKRDLRERAAAVMAQLGRMDCGILDLIIENAQHYAELQDVCDASPYSPNSFEVLAQVGSTDGKVLSFVQDIAQGNSGVVARRAAADVLSRL